MSNRNEHPLCFGCGLRHDPRRACQASKVESSFAGFAICLVLMAAIFAYGFLSSKCSAAIVHVDCQLTITTETPFGLDPSMPPDMLFTPKMGAGWEISANWRDLYTTGSFRAYNGVLWQCAAGEETFPAYWPTSALMWGGQWENDGAPVYVMLFSNPENNRDWSNTHHGWLRLGWNPDNSLTLYEWAYETAHDTPLIVGAVPEPEYWMLAAVTLVCLILMRRKRTDNLKQQP
jgi:hypothetical protein